MKAIIITGKKATDSEYVYAYYRLQEAGYEVDVAVRGKETVLGEIGVKIVPTMDIPLSVYRGYKLLVLPGGAKAMEYLRQDMQIINYIRQFHELGKPIASICHGAQLLISAGLVKGRRISGYYSIKDDINNAGGTYVDAPFVTDGNIVTSPHYKHLGAWMKEVLRVCQKARGAGEGDVGVQ